MTPAEREEVQAYHREWYRNRQAKKK